jgi:hypothetical protein
MLSQARWSSRYPEPRRSQPITCDDNILDQPTVRNSTGKQRKMNVKTADHSVTQIWFGSDPEHSQLIQAITQQCLFGPRATKPTFVRHDCSGIFRPRLLQTRFSGSGIDLIDMSLISEHFTREEPGQHLP